ncbi:hypothetical protein M0R45_030769 [Rubus argutus]|uniref:Histone H2A C-terminal domain-containing protein n=1 Tax=Rubus argutus TaxID=59490 RepID=A0AAW1WBY2_RUBAR
MPMVDYASSNDDVSEEENRENKENEPAQVPMDDDPQPPTTRPQAQQCKQRSKGEAYNTHASAACYSRGDEELNTLIKGTIAGSGVIPHIH